MNLCSVRGCENNPVYFVEVVVKCKSKWFTRCECHLVEGYRGKVEHLKIVVVGDKR